MCCRTRLCALSYKFSAAWPKYFRDTAKRSSDANARGYTLLGFAAVWLLLVVCLRGLLAIAWELGMAVRFVSGDKVSESSWLSSCA